MMGSAVESSVVLSQWSTAGTLTEPEMDNILSNLDIIYDQAALTASRELLSISSASELERSINLNFNARDLTKPHPKYIHLGFQTLFKQHALFHTFSYSFPILCLKTCNFVRVIFKQFSNMLDSEFLSSASSTVSSILFTHYM
jgi:hypothetical protein